jgi:hypothetical protein
MTHGWRPAKGMLCNRGGDMWGGQLVVCLLAGSLKVKLHTLWTKLEEYSSIIAWLDSEEKYSGCWVEFILRPTVSRPVRLGIGLLWREDGSVTYSAIADWSGHWRPVTIHCLIWDCVPSSSPPTCRDCGGGILTRLHMGIVDVAVVHNDSILNKLSKTRFRGNAVLSPSIVWFRIWGFLLWLNGFITCYKISLWKHFGVMSANSAWVKYRISVTTGPDSSVIY